MASKGTCESLAILGCVKVINDQFFEHIEKTPELSDIIKNLNIQLEIVFHYWDEKLTRADMLRVVSKLEALSDKIPMDTECDITVVTSFVLALLEDLSLKLKPCKQNAMRHLIRAVLMLHEYFEQPEAGCELECNLIGARSADAWEMEAIQ
jgi:hypothetical protein